MWLEPVTRDAAADPGLVIDTGVPAGPITFLTRGISFRLITDHVVIFNGDFAVTPTFVRRLSGQIQKSIVYVDVPSSAALNFGSGDFTVDLWVYFNTTAGEQVLIETRIQGAQAAVGWTLTKLDGDVLRQALASGNGAESNMGGSTRCSSPWAMPSSRA